MIKKQTQPQIFTPLTYFVIADLFFHNVYNSYVHSVTCRERTDEK
jgi:hypothetical protein